MKSWSKCLWMGVFVTAAGLCSCSRPTGTENGQRGAYVTETAAATICNIRVANGSIRISATNKPIPQE